MRMGFLSRSTTSRPRQVLLTACLALAIDTASVAQFLNGNKLVEYMREYERALRKEPGASQPDAMMYLGYVSGVYDALSSTASFCPPRNATVGQVSAVVS